MEKNRVMKFNDIYLLTTTKSAIQVARLRRASGNLVSLSACFKEGGILFIYYR